MQGESKVNVQDEITPRVSGISRSESGSNRKIEIAFLGIIVLYVFVLMYPFTMQGKALMPDTWKSVHPWAQGVDISENNTSIYDTVLEYGPWFEYSQTCLKEGRVPHWNPWQFCGAPLYANRLIPFFYPPLILAELIAHPHTIIAWFQFFNLILSGWGMFYLLRRWKMSPVVALVSSMLWLTCGVHFLPFPLWLLGVTGFPWLLWSLEGFLEKPGIRPVLTASFIAGLILMVGYPVLVVHLSYFTAVYFICRWSATRRTGPGRLHWTVPMLILAAVYLIGIGISAIANYPAYKYSQQTVRQVEGFQDASYEREKRMLITPPEEAGLDPIYQEFGETIDSILPINGRGTQRAWQYGGFIVYLLAFLGLLAGRPRARLLGILGFLFAVIIWIPKTYLVLIEILPAWGVTILLPFEVLNLIVYLLASCGIEALVNGVKDAKGRWYPDLYGRWLFTGIATASIFITWYLLKHAPVINLPFLTEVQVPDLLAYSGFHVAYLVTHGVLATLLALTILTSTNPHRILSGLILVGVLAFSMYTFFFLQPVYSEKDYTPETPFITWIQDQQVGLDPADGNRIARWADIPLPFNPHKRVKSPFTPNLHLPCGIMDIGGYDSLVPRNYITYCNGLMGEDMFMDYRALIFIRAPSLMYHQRLRALGVRWIISQGALPTEAEEGCTLAWSSELSGIEPIEDDDFIQVWEVDDPEPRAFLTRRVAYASDPSDDPIVQMANWAAQREEMVVVEDPEQVNRSVAWAIDNESDELALTEDVQIIFNREEPEFLQISVNAPDDCYLVLRDGWSPEWKAYEGNYQMPIYRADGAFRAIRLSRGSHVVEFIYNPDSYKTGLWITIGSLMLLVVLYSISGGRTRKERPTPSNL